jgi:VIT1/CCC1 family predicted Fe2+/Mn2+ transporter
MVLHRCTVIAVTGGGTSSRSSWALSPVAEIGPCYWRPALPLRSPNRSQWERSDSPRPLQIKGFSGPLLDEVVATVTANRDKWVETILEEERHLQPVSNQDIMRSSVIITLATLVGHLIPLLPFVFLARSTALVLAVILSGVVLFGVGTYQALTRVGSWWKQGTRMILIGLGAAALGFAIGHLFHASGTL